jgi:hypothetical protein
LIRSLRFDSNSALRILKRQQDRDRAAASHGWVDTGLVAALDVHPRVAMRSLRHSKIAVTMEVYTEVPSEATRDALHRLGGLLG